MIVIPNRRQERRGTAANLAAVNEVLLAGEWCLEIDTGKVKFGDGVTAYNALPYVGELANLGNPAGDQLVYWDDTAQQFAFLKLGTGLAIGSGGDLDATGGSGGNVAADTHAAASKATPVDADEMPLVDSAASWALKKLTWANLKATLKTYFDTLYLAAGSADWTTIAKVTDEVRSSTTTLTNDSTLLVALGAGKVVLFEFEVWLFTANATMDYKLQFAYSGTITQENDRLQTTSAGAPNVDSQATGALLNAAGPSTAATAGLARATLKGSFVTNTAGTLSFQWAQNTSDPANITCRRGSYLRYKVVN